MLVVSNIEVKDSTASTAGELFCDMFCKGHDARMLDCYRIERFKTMNEVRLIMSFLIIQNQHKW